MLKNFASIILLFIFIIFITPLYGSQLAVIKAQPLVFMADDEFILFEIHEILPINMDMERENEFCFSAKLVNQDTGESRFLKLFDGSTKLPGQDPNGYYTSSIPVWEGDNEKMFFTFVVWGKEINDAIDSLSESAGGKIPENIEIRLFVNEETASFAKVYGLNYICVPLEEISKRRVYLPFIDWYPTVDNINHEWVFLNAVVSIPPQIEYDELDKNPYFLEDKSKKLEKGDFILAEWRSVDRGELSDSMFGDAKVEFNMDRFLVEQVSGESESLSPYRYSSMWGGIRQRTEFKARRRNYPYNPREVFTISADRIQLAKQEIMERLSPKQTEFDFQIVFELREWNTLRISEYGNLITKSYGIPIDNLPIKSTPIKLADDESKAKSELILSMPSKFSKVTGMPERIPRPPGSLR